MNFFVRLVLRLFLWALIFGLISGIFGVSLSLIQIADFYLAEGTTQSTGTHTYRVLGNDTKLLTEESLRDLQNIEGIAFVDPYLKPKQQITGSINYFGFQASYPVDIQGIPKRLGALKAQNRFRSSWDSADLESIPVLLPQQSITLYNSIAPQRGWPSLPEDSFLGISGVTLEIDTNNVRAVISGFDPDEFGTVVTVSAEKLFSIYKNLGFNPSYDYIIVETVPGLTRQQIRDGSSSIQRLGYQLASAREENFQQSLLYRIKYTITIFGFSILIGFLFLLYYNIKNILTPLVPKIQLYSLWAVQEHTLSKIGLLSFVFAIITGFISWIICFFTVIPAQKYIIDTITRLGFNAPSLRDTVKMSLETGITSSLLFFLINIFTIIFFHHQTSKNSQ